MLKRQSESPLSIENRLEPESPEGSFKYTVMANLRALKRRRHLSSNSCKDKASLHLGQIIASLLRISPNSEATLKSNMDARDSNLRSKARGYVGTVRSHDMNESLKSGWFRFATMAATSWLPPFIDRYVDEYSDLALK